MVTVLVLTNSNHVTQDLISKYRTLSYNYISVNKLFVGLKITKSYDHKQ